LKKIWDYISFLGLEDKSKDEILFKFKEIVLLNRIIFIMFIIMVLYMPFEAIFHGFKLFPILIVQLFLIGFTLFISKKKKFSAAKIYVYIISILGVGPVLFFVPEIAGNQYFIFPMMLIPIIFFNNKTYIYLASGFSIILFLSITATRHLVEDIIDVPYETLHMFSIVFMGMSLFFTFLIGLYFKGITLEYASLIELKNHLVEEKNKEILDSINYAKRIQQAILPPHRLVSEALPNSFVLYLPKDIVAGDFYWMERVGFDFAQPTNNDSDQPNNNDSAQPTVYSD
jgi:hypothetical protein